MKCPNCGANLEGRDEVKFCPYCGHKVDIPDKVPTTMAGAIYGVAKTVTKHIEKEQAAKRELEKKRQEEARKMVPKVLIGCAIVVIICLALLFVMHFME